MSRFNIPNTIITSSAIIITAIISFTIADYYHTLDLEYENTPIILDNKNFYFNEEDFITDVQLSSNTDYRNPNIFTYEISDYDGIIYYQIITNYNSHQNNYFDSEPLTYNKPVTCNEFTSIQLLEFEFPAILEITDCDANDTMFLLNKTVVNQMVINNSIFEPFE